MVRSVPGGGYHSVVRVSESDLEERNIFQDGLRKADVPKIKVERDDVVTVRCLEIFTVAGLGKPRYDVCSIYLRGVRHRKPFHKTIEPRRLESAVVPGLTGTHYSIFFWLRGFDR